MWVRVPDPVKLTKIEKEEIIEQTNEIVNQTKVLKEKIKRIDIKSGRIYFYEWVEQKGKYGIPIKPLIEGKYIEMPFARVTLYEKAGKKCSAEYQRYNGKWFTLIEGSITECLLFISDNMESFY